MTNYTIAQLKTEITKATNSKARRVKMYFALFNLVDDFNDNDQSVRKLARLYFEKIYTEEQMQSSFVDLPNGKTLNLTGKTRTEAKDLRALHNVENSKEYPIRIVYDPKYATIKNDLEYLKKDLLDRGLIKPLNSETAQKGAKLPTAKVSSGEAEKSKVDQAVEFIKSQELALSDLMLAIEKSQGLQALPKLAELIAKRLNNAKVTKAKS